MGEHSKRTRGVWALPMGLALPQHACGPRWVGDKWHLGRG